MTIERICGDEFDLQVLEGDYGEFGEIVGIEINGASKTSCDPGTRYTGSDPS